MSQKVRVAAKVGAEFIVAGVGRGIDFERT